MLLNIGLLQKFKWKFHGGYVILHISSKRKVSYEDTCFIGFPQFPAFYAMLY